MKAKYRLARVNVRELPRFLLEGPDMDVYGRMPGINTIATWQDNNILEAKNYAIYIKVLDSGFAFGIGNPISGTNALFIKTCMGKGYTGIVVS